MERQPNPVQDVVITAGGTREQIDDVRYVGNFSGGALGHALAEEFTAFGRSVLLLSPGSTLDRLGAIEGVEHRSFTSCADLQSQLTSVESANIVLQAAAVADYSPVQAEGKISSEQDELIIRMQRNPKILAMLREHFGKRCFIVGFKLLSGVETPELLEVGRRQMGTNDTNMCIANDLSDIGKERTVYALERYGSNTRIHGPTRLVARHIASTVLLAAGQNGAPNA